MTRAVLLLVFAACRPDPDPSELACGADEDCDEWGAFAPHCLLTYASSVGVCSECAADGDCDDGHICEANADGFGTCLTGSRT